ncbi:MAG: hypothetical protein ABI858_03875 [Pseudoxanthomonas sp.]
MATIFFLKDGKKANGDRLTRHFEIQMDSATQHLAKYNNRFKERPPTINGDILANDFAPYKHVLLEVDQSETNTSFPKAGFYYLIGLTPRECQNFFSDPGSLE